MFEVENKYQVILEFNSPTAGPREFNRDLYIPFEVHEMSLDCVIKHNIGGAPTNTGFASLFTSLPLQGVQNSKLFTIGQQNSELYPMTKYKILSPNNNINGNYLFWLILSGSNGAPLLDADLAITLTFYRFKDYKN